MCSGESTSRDRRNRTTQDSCYRFAGYCLNVSRHTLERDGEPIKLTRAEYEMLVAFAATNPGEILSRERLLRMLCASGGKP
ncbi:hypothetical protein DMI62_09855 [Escherichia coli]|nr:hypothetical protein [Escherichia coli]